MRSQHTASTAEKQVPSVLADLNLYKQWVGYNAEKKPLNPRGGFAKADDPSTWGTRPEADNRSPGKVGIEFGPIVGRDDLCLAGVDLDGCRDLTTKAIAPWAREIVAKLGTYVELSPSGKGLHALFLYRPSDLSGIESATPSATGGQWKPEAGIGVEFYFRGRYFTVTDDQFGPRSGLKLLGVEAVKWIVSAGDKLMAGNVEDFPKERSKKFDEAAALRDLMTGASFHPAAISLAGYWAKTGVAIVEAHARLKAAFEAIDPSDRDDRWKSRFKQIPEILQYTYGKAAVEEAGIVEGFEEIDNSFDQIYHDRIGYSDEELRNFGRGAAKGEIGDDGIFEFTNDIGGTSKSTLVRNPMSKLLNLATQVDFIEGILYERDASTMIGRNSTTKTFFIVDLAMHAALGLEWRGRKVKQTNGLYVALEGAGGIRKRVEAWCKHHGVDLLTVPLATMSGSLNLQKGDSAALQDIIAYARELKAKWIIIETLARTMPGGNESASEDVSRVIQAINAIRDQTGAHLTMVHHAGKSEAAGSRGWSGLLDAMETELTAKRIKQNLYTVTLTKQRDGDDGSEWAHRRKVIELGYKTYWGKPVTSCVLEVTELDTAEEEKLPPAAKKMLVILRGLAGAPPQPVPIKEWKKAGAVLGAVSGNDDYKQRHKAATRGFSELVDAQLIKVEGKEGAEFALEAGMDFEELEEEI